MQNRYSFSHHLKCAHYYMLDLASMTYFLTKNGTKATTEKIHSIAEKATSRSANLSELLIYLRAHAVFFVNARDMLDSLKE